MPPRIRKSIAYIRVPKKSRKLKRCAWLWKGDPCAEIESKSN
jgi:hypothetical protein